MALAHAILPQGSRSVVLRRAGEAKIIHLSFVIQADGHITTCDQIGMHLERAPENLGFIVIDAMGLRDAPELAARSARRLP